jgi:Zn2+/Cd2+-exporting ATPase
MGAGAALAMESADVTLLDSNLEKIEYCIALGRRVTNVIEQNVTFSLVVKFVVLVLAVMGWTNLWAAIASDVGSMLIVTLNAMKILPPPQHRRRSRKDIRMSNNNSDIENPISP